MGKRLINICIVVILLFGIYGCARTAEDAPVVEIETVKTENTDAESEIVETEHTEHPNRQKYSRQKMIMVQTPSI